MPIAQDRDGLCRKGQEVAFHLMIQVNNGVGIETTDFADVNVSPGREAMDCCHHLIFS